MTKEKILAEISAFINNQFELYRLEAIVENLKEDIRVEELKKTTPKNSALVMKKNSLIKALLKSAGKSRNLSEGYIFGYGKYCFTDTFRIYYLNDNFGYSAIKTELDVEKLIDDDYDKTVELNLAELKSLVKIYKAEGNKDRYIYYIEGYTFNAQYLIEAIEMIGSNKLMLKAESKSALGRFENAEGEIALICPIFNRGA
ncbi:MAG: hypothetical protein WCO84_00955 [bacterium]